MYLHLETERLRLRPLQLADAEFIRQLVNTDGWLRFIGNRQVANRADAERYIQNILDSERFFYQIFALKATHQPVGVVTFLRRASLAHPDIGFALLPAFENQGYAFEAVSGYLHKIRQSNQYENVLGITMPTNVKSIRLLTKLGLHFHHDFEQNGETLALYSLEAAHQ